jgi:acylphosphatase
MENKKLFLQLKIKGNFGVGFRRSLKEKAEELDVCGYVKNTSEVELELEVYGKKESIHSFLEFCNVGNGKRNIFLVETTEIKAGSEFKGFKIIPSPKIKQSVLKKLFSFYKNLSRG